MKLSALDSCFRFVRGGVPYFYDEKAGRIIALTEVPQVKEAIRRARDGEHISLSLSSLGRQIYPRYSWTLPTDDLWAWTLHSECSSYGRFSEKLLVIGKDGSLSLESPLDVWVRSGRGEEDLVKSIPAEQSVAQALTRLGIVSAAFDSPQDAETALREKSEAFLPWYRRKEHRQSESAAWAKAGTIIRAWKGEKRHEFLCVAEELLPVTTAANRGYEHKIPLKVLYRDVFKRGEPIVIRVRLIFEGAWTMRQDAFMDILIRHPADVLKRRQDQRIPYSVIAHSLHADDFREDMWPTLYEEAACWFDAFEAEKVIQLVLLWFQEHGATAYEAWEAGEDED